MKKLDISIDKMCNARGIIMRLQGFAWRLGVHLYIRTYTEVDNYIWDYYALDTQKNESV